MFSYYIYIYNSATNEMRRVRGSAVGPIAVGMWCQNLIANYTSKFFDYVAWLKTNYLSKKKKSNC